MAGETAPGAQRGPQPLGPMEAHYWLVQQMARCAGVDLARAMTRGALTQQDWAGMVHACRGCGWSEACARWLDRTGPAEAGSPPEACANCEMLRRLKAANEDEDATDR